MISSLLAACCLSSPPTVNEAPSPTTPTKVPEPAAAVASPAPGTTTGITCDGIPECEISESPAGSFTLVERSQEVGAEYWLVGGGTTRPLLDTRDTEFGASGGEATVTVVDGQLVYEAYGGSSTRWFEGEVASIDPFRVLEMHSGYNGPFNSENQELRFDFRTWSGTGERVTADCDEGEGQPTEQHWTIIPRAKMPPGFVPPKGVAESAPDAGWRSTTTLDGCATKLDASGKNGFVTWGEPGEPSDASMTLLAAVDSLVVHVSDDNWVTTSDKGWVYADHLEVWFSRNNSACESYGDLVQVAVTTDGRHEVAYGSLPGALAVETTVTEDGSTRFRVSMGDFDAVSVVYSDSDDGVNQERLLATSTVGPYMKTPAALGAVTDLRATCVLEEGHLVGHADAPEDMAFRVGG